MVQVVLLVAVLVQVVVAVVGAGVVISRRCSGGGSSSSSSSRSSSSSSSQWSVVSSSSSSSSSGSGRGITSLVFMTGRGATMITAAHTTGHATLKTVAIATSISTPGACPLAVILLFWSCLHSPAASSI